MLDKIIFFSIKNKLIIGMCTITLIIWGVWSAIQLPIDAVPDITNNQVQIITVCPTLASQEVEQQVTYPIEQSMANLPDIDATCTIYGIESLAMRRGLTHGPIALLVLELLVALGLGAGGWALTGRVLSADTGALGYAQRPEARHRCRVKQSHRGN